MNRVVLIVGLVITACIVGVLFAALGKNPQKIESPLIGREAPRFALREVGTGRTVDLASLRGKPVVINFWATWCAPCYTEHPVLVETAQRLAPGVHFLGVVFDDSEEKILAFLRDRGSSYPTVVDQAGKTAIAYGVGGVPETFFVNPSGRLVSRYDGPITQELLIEHIEKARR